MKNQDCMQYQDGIVDIKSEIMDEVLEKTSKFDYKNYTKDDVFSALEKKNRNLDDFAALLSVEAQNYLEDMAQISAIETRAKFGNNINIFTPLYISNYCDSTCVYCGYSAKNKIQRAKLSLENIDLELENIAKLGIEDILILTGESRGKSSVEYIGEACKRAKELFKVVSIEIYPLNVDEYAFLHECGVDFVNVYQETYNPKKYQKIHLSGEKMVFPYRFNSQERAILGGMRGAGFAALLGIDDFRKDAFATGLHANLISKKYPHAEISLSCPRLRPIINNSRINPQDVHEKELLQIIMAYRLFMPFATITVSTRERKNFRDNAIKIAANKISAGVSVAIGGHSKKVGDEQFELSDYRSVKSVCEDIKKDGFYPLMSEYIYV
ncbi:2-iminoacetate synthase [Campylobacter blaseri]|uniref:2-iminoacetate synthase ThiH n=1 Tax=Campylobacter blaseri TaxID=2042961 RepID=A0A2P8QZ45_9BACT|nr:2-iminoacetate synthase ThiH [Campylobacter blaseri]PSM51501.1 2-iminoacetate synthase ThiH [Campylobacter blaseri]PSM52950.1 2-iminoacetate synthase ThiH [Campylobacter blaseri]QKF86488.1 2-iminoacetate synthase [Campylobacter blaseri]